MPRAMYICPVCHKNVLASKAIHIKTRYYHKACLDKKIKKEKEKIDNDKLTKKQREQYERALKQSALPEIPEAVPESERMYLGDMDSKDSDYRRILYYPDKKREV